MSSVASPFGLKPAWHPSGILRQQQGTIISGLAVNIFQFSPVQIDTTGGLLGAVVGTRAVGSFMGVEFTDAEGRRRVSNRWLANTVATDIVAYYTADPLMVYEIQGNAPITLLRVGEQMDWSALAGNATTGLSSVALNVASSAANAGLRVIGLNPGPDNIFGDAFTVVQVQISEHQFVADVAAI
jgi:hypothetical protein